VVTVATVVLYEATVTQHDKHKGRESVWGPVAFTCSCRKNCTL